MFVGEMDVWIEEDKFFGGYLVFVGEVVEYFLGCFIVWGNGGFDELNVFCFVMFD